MQLVGVPGLQVRHIGSQQVDPRNTFEAEQSKQVVLLPVQELHRASQGRQVVPFRKYPVTHLEQLFDKPEQAEQVESHEVQFFPSRY